MRLKTFIRRFIQIIIYNLKNNTKIDLCITINCKLIFLEKLINTIFILEIFEYKK